MNRNRLRKRVAKATALVAPSGMPPAQTLPDRAGDAAELAREIGEAFGGMVRHYREHYALTADEARERASEAPQEYLDRILTGPPDQVSWFSLDSVAQDDPEKALALWERVQQAASHELRSGLRAARALDGCDEGCWDRARFLAVRAELAEGVRPRSGVEQLLVDQLAQWQALLWRWQEIVATYTSLTNMRGKKSVKEREEVRAPYLAEAEWFQRAVQMVERLHRLYLRTLKALQDQRRTGGVFVRHAGQVNVAHQQVNVNAPCGRARL